MALELDFSLEESDDSSSVRITDTTGVYNATSNKGGWGAPNHAIGTATAATITFKKRSDDGTFTTYNAVDVYNDLPSNAEGFINISAEDAGFGVDSVFPDGIYELTYTVSGVDGTAYTVVEVFSFYLIGGICCCYTEAALNVANCSCGCDKIEESFIELDRKMRLLQCAIRKGDYTLIQNYINSLTRLCSECGCGSV